MTGPEPAVLSVAGLHVTFPGAAGRVPAVRGVGFDLARGEALGIVGESGSGKSVASLAVMGLLPGNAEVRGSVRLDGEELIGRDDATLSKIRGARISMVFQDPLSALTPVYSVGDQIAEAVRAHTDMPRGRAARRAIDLLDLVGIPNAAQRARAFPHEFSGGMRQRVMIAMAVAGGPDVIIADEPTTALDVTIQAQILDVFATARAATGAAVVMITHDLGVVAGFAERVLVMYAGRVVESGAVDDVYYRPRMPYTMGLLGAVPRVDAAARTPLVPIEGAPPSPAALPSGCPFRPRCPMAVDVCRTAEPGLLPVGRTGHAAACHRSGEIEDAGMAPAEVFAVPEIPAPEAAALPRDERAPVLAVEGLVRHFPLMKGAVLKRRTGTVRAVDGIGFDIRAGETLGLVGESGCGKTTTLHEVLALARPQAGRITVLGHDTAALTRRGRRALRRDMQVVFQDPTAALDPRMPVADILAEPLRAQGRPRGEVRARVRRLLDLVGLAPEHRARYPADFSGGQRQRIGIARALALEPRLVVLDEPVSALDVSIQAGIVNLLDDLRARLDLAYLFVAHDLSVVRHIADRVAVMYLGRIVEIGAADTVFAAPAHPYTRALLSAIPIPDPHKERARTRVLLSGDLPSPAAPPSGCRFHTRCPKFAAELTEEERRPCREDDPRLRAPRTGADQRAACHYASS
ncbi:MAG TPA: ABC transporter ATP-binding protein [Streptosporangiaceae bacterium]